MWEDFRFFVSVCVFLSNLADFFLLHSYFVCTSSNAPAQHIWFHHIFTFFLLFSNQSHRKMELVPRTNETKIRHLKAYADFECILLHHPIASANEGLSHYCCNAQNWFKIYQQRTIRLKEITQNGNMVNLTNKTIESSNLMNWILICKRGSVLVADTTEAPAVMHCWFSRSILWYSSNYNGVSACFDIFMSIQFNIENCDGNETHWYWCRKFVQHSKQAHVINTAHIERKKKQNIWKLEKNSFISSFRNVQLHNIIVYTTNVNKPEWKRRKRHM